MRYICLDTNIYIGCALLTEHQQEPKQLRSIKNIIENHDVKFLVPEVIKSEFYGRIKDKNEEIIKELNDLKGEIGKKSFKSEHDKNQLQKYIDKLKETRDNAFKEAQIYIEALFSSSNCIEIPLTNEIIVNSYLRQVSNLRPFIKEKHSKNRPLPISVDCIIIESLKSYFMENNSSEDVLYFCTNDSDFYEDVVPHPDIKDTFPVGLNMFKYLPKLLESFGEQLSEEEKEQFIKIQKRINQWYIPSDKFQHLQKAFENMYIPSDKFQHLQKAMENMYIQSDKFQHLQKAMERIDEENENNNEDE